MTSYRPVDSKREEFRKYLEKAGAMDALTKVLVMLYDEPEKPADALDYIRKHLGDNNRPDDAELNALKIEVEESRLRIQTLLDQIKVLKEKLSQYEPVDMEESEGGELSSGSAMLDSAHPTMGGTKTVAHPTMGPSGTVAHPTMRPSGTVAQSTMGPTSTVAPPTDGLTSTVNQPMDGPTSTVAHPTVGGTKTVAQPVDGPTSTVAHPTVAGTKTVAHPTVGGTKTVAQPMDGPTSTVAQDGPTSTVAHPTMVPTTSMGGQSVAEGAEAP